MPRDAAATQCSSTSPPRHADRILAEPDDSFDLVVVDGNEAGVPEDRGRVACALAARPKVKPGGNLILDDSDRPRYAPADAALAGWDRRRFTGFPNVPLTATETTFYRRPA